MTDTGHKHENIKPMTLSLQTQERTFISNEMSGIETFCVVPVLFLFRGEFDCCFNLLPQKSTSPDVRMSEREASIKVPGGDSTSVFEQQQRNAGLVLIILEKEHHTQLSHSSSQNTNLSSGSLCPP